MHSSRRAMFNSILLVRMLSAPERCSSLSGTEWDLLIRQARRANLLGKLGDRLRSMGRLEAVPLEPRKHLLSALKMVERQNAAIRWEVECLAQALKSSRIHMVLLKGAAYVLSQVSAHRGRTFSDVDVLVAKRDIQNAESALLIHGWQGAHHDEYDQRYYRTWMHEIPPMRHVRRGTTVDLHHTILPETARIKINTEALLSDPLPLPGFERLCVLKPADMLLHSATHLFHEGELENGLRDLYDLDEMFREFAARQEFWGELLERAVILGLERPLFYAAHFCTQLIGTPIPNHVCHRLAASGPPALIRNVMNWCYRRAFRPHHDSCRQHGMWLARHALYIRAHWLRMPTLLLIRHLAHKAFLSPKPHEVLPKAQ